jgi:enoyl-CoA hydratase/carnithine racemase
MTADAALATGLISAVDPADALEARLQAFIKRLLSFPPMAVAAVKQYLGAAPQGDAQAAAILGASMLSNVLASR